MKSLYNRITEKVEAFKKSLKQNGDLKKLIKYLREDEYLSIKEACAVCEESLKEDFDRDAFLASSLLIDLEKEEPVSYIAEDGSTILTIPSEDI